MGNLVAFINSFISYLLVFVVFAAVIIAAVKVGITARHKKDAKDAQNAQSADAQDKSYGMETFWKNRKMEAV